MEFYFLYSAAVKAENNIFCLINLSMVLHRSQNYITCTPIHLTNTFSIKDLKVTSLQGQYPDFPAPVSHVNMFSVW